MSFYNPSIVSKQDFEEIFNGSIVHNLIEFKSKLIEPIPDDLIQIQIEIIGIEPTIDVETFSSLVKRVMDELEGFTRIQTDVTYIKLVYYPLFCYQQNNDYLGYQKVCDDTFGILRQIFNDV